MGGVRHALRQKIQSLPQIEQAYRTVRQGLLVPSEVKDLKTYARCESFLREIECQGVVTRLLTESSLTAEWDGLDRIFVFGQEASASSTSSMSSIVKRALQGFEAAGGEVLFYECTIE